VRVSREVESVGLEEEEEEEEGLDLSWVLREGDEKGKRREV
jgi:hypothetical protein